MDGKDRWMDNVIIEWLWRSLKYEAVYLKAYETVTEARAGIKEWIKFYNYERTHQSLDRQTPSQVYFSESTKGWLPNEQRSRITSKNRKEVSKVWGPLQTFPKNIFSSYGDDSLSSTREGYNVDRSMVSQSSF